MTDFSQQSAAATPAYAAPAAPAPANPYLAQGAAPSGQQVSPYAPQPGDVRFNPNTRQADPTSDIMPSGADPLQRVVNQQDQNVDAAGKAQVGDSITLSDGTAYVVTAENQQLNTQFVQSVDAHFGQGSFDAMLQFAGTLSQGEQATLERLVLSGDPASMTRAANYVIQKMQGQQSQRPQQQLQQPQYQQPQQPQYVAPTQYSAPAGLSQAEFYRELDNLKAHGIHEGHHAYRAAYQNLVAARAAGKRAGR